MPFTITLKVSNDITLAINLLCSNVEECSIIKYRELMCTIVSSLDSNVKEVLIRISGYPSVFPKKFFPVPSPAL